ncbi:MAG: MBL fold metallo-hydrolase [Candidatus Abyssobacteria bacterium SURF_17]|uniref:MBL fold metallo-hydrolase n=1 Tax=Candidatus Abyssobacteria bacterium SURF_17 TaxID=2093361 RepID=A0A419ERM9_9BACT|nr:MAG: MBL fold metallo-hydrolase [Candidatus Abyssubacteria bacterium SURF_17]
MSEPAERLLARLGIHRIETPSPFSAVTTNSYFIDGDEPTLIDSGLATEEAYESVLAGLAHIGRKIADIKRIILTHGHADHRALAPRIVEETGAEAFCHPLEIGKVTYVSQEQKTRVNSEATAFFRTMGVPEESIPALVEGPKSPTIKPRLKHVSFLNDAEEIQLGMVSLQVLHTPGHSSGSICLYEPDNRLLFTGDTLLPTSRITALIELDMLLKNPEYDPLKQHLESLQRLFTLQAAHVLPGHGEDFHEYESVVRELGDRHEKRQRHILRALRHEPRTLYEICRSVFLFASPDDLFLALSEVLGNIQILLQKRIVTEHYRERIAYYEKA